MDTETTQEGGDDVRSELIAAMTTDEAPTDEELDAPITEEVEETEAESESRNRDEKGRFKKKADEPETEVLETDKEPAENTEPQEVETATDDRVAPPQEWSGNAKVRWEKLPKDIQAEIAKDYSNVNEQRQRYAALDNVLEPRKQALTVNHGSVEQGINYLFSISDYAEKNPAEFIQWFAQQRGIDLAQNAPQEGQPQQHPDMSAALQEIQTLKQELGSIKQNTEQSHTQALQSQIDTFARDPKHPYFNDVKQVMSALMNSGKAETLEAAYDMAVYADPTIRAQMQAQEQERVDAEKREKAERAKKAAGSIGGSPVDTSIDSEPALTVRGELERQMQASRV